MTDSAEDYVDELIKFNKWFGKQFAKYQYNVMKFPPLPEDSVVLITEILAGLGSRGAAILMTLFPYVTQSLKDNKEDFKESDAIEAMCLYYMKLFIEASNTIYSMENIFQSMKEDTNPFEGLDFDIEYNLNDIMEDEASRNKKGS